MLCSLRQQTPFVRDLWWLGFELTPDFELSPGSTPRLLGFEPSGKPLVSVQHPLNGLVHLTRFSHEDLSPSAPPAQPSRSFRNSVSSFFRLGLRPKQ